MIKVIFLDIDGVIATEESLDKNEKWGLVDQKQELLKLILKETGAMIVLSSSWRRHTVEETKAYMQSKGFRFCENIIGVTVRGYHHIEKGFPMSIPRGVEIKQWIDNNICRENGKGSYTIKKVGIDFSYVILDDDTDMLLEQAKYFVNTDHNIGLTLSDCKRCIEILNANATKI